MSGVSPLIVTNYENTKKYESAKDYLRGWEKIKTTLKAYFFKKGILRRIESNLSKRLKILFIRGKRRKGKISIENK